ncbi:MAG TPA: oligoendopeptidase F, partial [Kaistiaceae bacterium]|nr:oligoendopeptidase F [Kaistiaceae bacterium]
MRPTSDPIVRSAAKAGAAADAALGDLPEWNLADLYKGIDAPEVQRDLKTALADAQAFETKYKGTLDGLARKAGGPKQLGAAVAAFEQLEELLGRLISFAGLVYAGDTSDPKRAKFYGDVQERITAASSHLLFFTLELNRIDDKVLEAAMAEPTLGHYRPWLEDIRKDKPYELEDRIEQLFHEKSVTGRGAWNRLYDETLAALRFTVDGETLTLEPALNLMQHSDENKRRAAAEEIGRVLGENQRVFTLVTNTLAKDKEISDRWRGFEDIADSRHLANRVEREVVEAMVSAVRDAYPRLSHRYYALKAKWFGKEALDYWDRNAPLPKVPQRTIPWGEARDTVLSAYARFSPDMSDIARRFFDKDWIDAPVRPGRPWTA